MELWNDLTLNAYGLAFALMISIAPILVLLFATRVIGRSTKKTIRILKKK